MTQTACIPTLYVLTCPVCRWVKLFARDRNDWRRGPGPCARGCKSGTWHVSEIDGKPLAPLREWPRPAPTP